MTNVHDMLPIIADTSFNRLCEVDEYISFIWSRRYYDVGDFELVISMSSPNRIYMVEGNYVIRESIDEVGIIEHIAITVDLNRQEMMVITGRFLSSIIGRRIIAQQTQVSGTIESCVKKLINENAITPSDSNRTIPGLQYGTWDIPTTTMQQQYTGKNLLDVLQDICKQFNIGFRVDLSANNAFTLVLYTGVDRSYNQTENPYVVFSNEYDNLASSDYSEDYENRVTDVLVAGEGEGLERKTVWASERVNAGLARYELFVDARNASTNNGEISDVVYFAQLREEGLESITDVLQAFAGSVYLTNLTLGVDFNVGDVCVIENRKWGITANARLVEVIESVSESGVYSVTPTFDIGASTVISSDTTEYIDTQHNMQIMTQQDVGPLMLQSGTFDAQNSPYSNAVKITELPALATPVAGNWFAIASDEETYKLDFGTLWQKVVDYIGQQGLGVDAITALTQAGSGAYVPTAASAYASADATGWNVQEYASGLVHCFGIIDTTNIAITTAQFGGYRSADRHMRLPVGISRLLSLHYGESLGGSANGRMTAYPSGGTSTWQGTHYSLQMRFFAWTSTAAATGNHLYIPVDLWAVKA